MNKDEFIKYLEEIGINKIELAELLSLPYSTVNKWGSSNPYPAWLKSWFENHIKAGKFDKIAELIKPMV